MTRNRGLRLALSAGIALTLAISMLSVGRTANASGPTTVGLGTAGGFAVLAGTGITNAGATTLKGDDGSYATAPVAGWDATVVRTGTSHGNDLVAKGAKDDLATAYDTARLTGGSSAVAAGSLAGTLVGGVYKSTGFTMSLPGLVILDGQNDPSSVWIFQATSDLVTAVGSEVRLTNGASPCNVFWQVTSSATINGSKFKGTILALTSITIGGGVTLDGRALARNGNVTMINDTIATPTCGGTAAGGPTITYDTICIDNALIQRTFSNGIAVAQTRLAGPCTSGPFYYTATSTPAPTLAAVMPTATPGVLVAPVVAPSASPLDVVLALPFTSTLEDNALTFLILPLVIIVFTVLYLVARARRRRAPPAV